MAIQVCPDWMDSHCPFKLPTLGSGGFLTVSDPHLLNRARLLQARTIVSEWNPFLGHLVLQMPVRIQKDGPCQTAWVDGRGVCSFHQAFLSQLSSAETAAVLLHETLHLALDCFARQGGRDGRLWNMAHDLAVNQLIEDSRECHQPVAWPSGFRPLLEVAFKDMAAEAIYELLWDTLSLPRESDPWPGHPGVAPPARQEEIRQRWGSDRLEAAEDILPQVIDLDLQEGPGASPEERDRLRRKWQEGLLSAAERAMGEKGIGSLPAWAQRLLGPLLQPQVPWQEVLARKVHGHLQGERRSFARPGRRSHSVGAGMPGRLRHRGVVGVFVDVSGSVSPGELHAFFGELKWILATTGHAVRLVTWDMAVGEDLYFEDASDLDLALAERDHRMAGGGGTDPRCVIERLEAGEADHPLPSFGVVLTDGMVPWPEASDWPLDLVVACTGPLPPARHGYDALTLSLD